jgi:hypothetical protein
MLKRKLLAYSLPISLNFDRVAVAFLVRPRQSWASDTKEK